ncbi:biotin transporter BioY [Sporohalobacter salinus]|uniref:biotin transporter BioY n=1 Tax=Sporohalobacter salinus TaxID=1494606 RepID=UPI0019621DBE|nr:biotin transporter BioY [Sporohalobacter salinus]MBM7625024.1 biotin transport system substrate-specific component [Sporohalobacter salinus]
MNSTVKEILIVSLFAALTAVGAVIMISLGAVPLTLQVFFVLLSGSFLGAKRGALSQVIYLIIGAIGLPVYAGGGAGLTYFAGPTSGFLLSFPISSYIVGRLIEDLEEEEIDFNSIIIRMSIGLIIIYILGVTGLSLATKMGLKESIVTGILPFIIPDIIKVLAGTYFTLKLKKV